MIYCHAEEGTIKPLKIGHTNGEQPRKQGTYNWRRLECLAQFDGSRLVETKLHKIFADRRVGNGGREWFDVTIDEVTEVIQPLLAVVEPVKFSSPDIIRLGTWQGCLRFLIKKTASASDKSAFESLAKQLGKNVQNYGSRFAIQCDRINDALRFLQFKQ